MRRKIALNKCRIAFLFILSLVSAVSGVSAQTADGPARKPTSAAEYNNLGVGLFERGELEKAADAFRKSIAAAPDGDEAEKTHYNLGAVYAQMKRYDEAIAALERAVELDATAVKPRAKLCDVYLSEEKNEKALACYERLLALAPRDGQSHSNYGVALMRQNRLGEAVGVFEKAARLDAGNAEIHNNLGVALLAAGRAGEAVAALRRALEIAPGSDRVRYNLAIAALAARDRSAALEQYGFLKTSNAALARKLFETISREKIVFVK